MGWLIVGVLIAGGICGVFNVWRESMAQLNPADDEFNHSEGENGYDDE